jgi:hypothetical protein
MRSVMHWNDWRTIFFSLEAAKEQALLAMRGKRLRLVAAHDRKTQLLIGQASRSRGSQDLGDNTAIASLKCMFSAP